MIAAVIGTGKIGASFAHIMQGFGCKLLGYDIQKNETLIQYTGIKYVDMQTLCAQSDIISLHCPLNNETRYLLNEKSFGWMKPGTILINTARGAIVNTRHLTDALDKGIIGAAGLDVYEYEKPLFFYDHRQQLPKGPLLVALRSYPNVLITGHQAFLTKEALTGITQTTFSNIGAWERTGKCDNYLFI